MSKTQKTAQATEIEVDQDEEILSDPLTDELDNPELFFGLVGAIGTDLDKVYKILKKVLNDLVGYRTEQIKLTEIISTEADRKEPDRYQRYLKKMNAGTTVRKFYKRPDAVILKGLSGVRAARRRSNSNLTLGENEDPAEIPVDDIAFVFNSLKRPEEVDTLRRVYGQSFFLIGAYAPRESRVITLAKRIADSRNKQNSEEFRPQAEELIEKDRADHGDRLGQAVQKTFPEADIFINIDDENKAQKEVSRFIRLIFGDAFFTPRREEQAMFLAKAAALRSADLGRQVGAVIMSPEGDVVAIGTNEVPKAKGGQYWETDDPDQRDFQIKSDPNDKMRQKLIGDISSQLETNIRASVRKLIGEVKRSNVTDKQVTDLVNKSVEQSQLASQIAQSQMTNLIAYIRAVHAEMAALMDAARRGISVRGNVLVCTTFPCHECARHIIASGISRVLYIEPYPKSLTTELFPDSVVVDNPQSKDTFVHFLPFVGVAPRQFMSLFDASRIERKQAGDVIEWDAATARPRRSEAPQAYIFKETRRLHFLDAYDRKNKPKKENRHV